MLRLPREIRSMIYENLTHMFKAYSGAFVTSNLQPSEGDVYMFDTGAWYSIKHFRGQSVGSETILEFDAAPWAHQNLSHFFNRTPARHLKCLDPQILDECIDDICLRAGKVRLSMQYRNHQNPHKYDKILFNSFARHARDLTLTIAYNGIYSKLNCTKATTLGYGRELDEKLTVIDDLVEILQSGCKMKVLTLYLNFDIPFTDDCRLTVNEAWVQDRVTDLTKFGCSINLCIYNRYDERYPISGYGCPMWEHIFSYRSSFERHKGWTRWTKQAMSVYEAASLECR
jgi:hypothetical protein